MPDLQAIREFLQVLSILLLPLIIVAIPLYGLARRVPVYEKFVEGAKEGFTIAVMIIPYLVAILFAIGMFRASGGMEMLIEGLRVPLTAIGVPPEILPMALARPLTGSGSLGVLADMVEQHGTDSMLTKIAATIYGSTETTFYVIAVYFGAVGVKRVRHALPAGLIADVAAVFIAVYVITLLFA